MRRTRFCLLLIAPVFPDGLLWAQATTRPDVSTSGQQANAEPIHRPMLSADGRYVVFASAASNLVAGDTNNQVDVFVHDRLTGVTERESVDSAGVEATAGAGYPSISGDGRFVAFESSSTNLLPYDVNGALTDVFVHDRSTGSTTLVSVDSSGVQGNLDSHGAVLSADGRFVAFWSQASNLVSGDTNGYADVFLRDLQGGTTERVDLDSAGMQGNLPSYSGALSSDGRYVEFESNATNLVAGDVNMVRDIFVRDRLLGLTERVSVDSAGLAADQISFNGHISADGRWVAFTSSATNLVPGDTNGRFDVFVHDRSTGVTERDSVDSAGAQGLGESDSASISADGRFVAFYSSSTLVSGDTNGQYDVFVKDRQSGATERVNLSSDGVQANGMSAYWGSWISSDGRFVAFESDAPNLVAADTNGIADLFLRDRLLGGYASLCDPGSDGTIDCPCSNPQSGPGRGCDNSSSTGGASLAAAGAASLAADTLVFTSSGEKPNATTILVQCTSVYPAGQVLGQGVHCGSGLLKRLYVKSAIAGSILAPDFAAGDPSVSARSAALADVIAPMGTRWYFAFYRDATVLGGCPATSTYNATQMVSIQWWP